MAEVDEDEQSRAWLECRDCDTGIVVRAGGEMDVASLESLQREIDELLARDPVPLAIDMTDLRFIDSSGIAVLIRLANHFDAIEIRNANPMIRRVIQVLGLETRLPLGPD